MKTPIFDFVERYASSDKVRLHMPGHKGRGFLGVERYDVTEIYGADSLFEASGIIEESENNASRLFNTAKTLYSTEGSTLCIQAMLRLALLSKGSDTPPLILASRNAHKAFVNACALLDVDVRWHQGEGGQVSICTETLECEALEKELKSMPVTPLAVYITTPDYLGSIADVSAIAEVCHRYGTILIVDNAHGAYLHFLEESRHPISLGADLCCDSAHKTLPVLTGGAYLHISHRVADRFSRHAKEAMALFASTSPSYLILSSLDKCNLFLETEIKKALSEALQNIAFVKNKLTENGWQILPSEPLKITVKAPCGTTGQALAQRLRESNIECEYADRDFLVLMPSPANPPDDYERLISALGINHGVYDEVRLPRLNLPRAKSIREAILADSEILPVREALGRICASPTVSCPPAIPIAVSGEVITKEAIEVFEYYEIEKIAVVKTK